MNQLFKRYSQNPILRPADLTPSAPGLEIACLLNPGIFQYQGKTGMVVRVAERPVQQAGIVSFPVLTEAGMELMHIREDDPRLSMTDARVLNFAGKDYLTTLSHLRVLWSDDGVYFYEQDNSLMIGQTPDEFFGIEDCRVVELERRFYLTYTAVSAHGVCVGMRSTGNWSEFESHGIIFPPHNKDCALFPEKIQHHYVAFHRPSSVALGGNYIWLAQSPDLLHWGKHHCLIETRPGSWDSARVGAGASPIKTPEGWLQIYHGADEAHRYCLGGLLLDLDDPRRIIARSEEPLFYPETQYEREGFFGEVVFTNGHYLEADGDTLQLYYGAADELVCRATASVREILSHLLS